MIGFKKSLSQNTLMFFIVTSILSCSKFSVEPIENLYEGTIYVVGHGGAGFQSVDNPFPHNSLASIKRAIVNQAADGVELDVQITKDGKLVLYHDNDLNSMTWCTGQILEKNLSEVSSCEYKTDNLTQLHHPQRVVSLYEAMEWLGQRSVQPLIFLDFKWHLIAENENEPQIAALAVGELKHILNEISLGRAVNILTNSNTLFNLIKEEIPGVRLWLGTNNFFDFAQTAKEEGYYGIMGNNLEVSREMVSFAQNLGLKTALFSMKSQLGIVSGINKSPEYIIPDDIVSAKRILFTVNR
jgi:glycerophosphoryl diester phosphodiesterase